MITGAEKHRAAVMNRERKRNHSPLWTGAIEAGEIGLIAQAASVQERPEPPERGSAACYLQSAVHETAIAAEAQASPCM
jgi:hypothetical protein